ncbi:MAG: family 20 glycosylhydrolase [Melioribacteraceae bacterium]|nr:family 20 glycosylhydrolase [Melioribacteraceae bacterium]
MLKSGIKLFLIVLLFLFASSIVYSQNKKEQLIIFHFDFNSVSLNKDYVIKWIDKASQMGYNAILWEIEDDIKWETCPECASDDAFSKDEFKEIIKYSRSLGLEPIPLLQTIGHGEYVLQHEKYFSFREDSSRYDCYCTSNDDVKTFMKSWINEYLEIFGDVKYFHLGGDEAYAFATCDVCKSTADKVGKNKLYADYLNDIAVPLFEKNIRPGVWCDMILSHPDELDAISKKFVIWDWNYWDGDSSPERVMVWGKGRLAKDKITDEIKNTFTQIFDKDRNFNPFYTSDYLKMKGYEIILCSSARSYGDAVFVGTNNLHFDNIIGAARKTAKLDLLGTCVTSWAVRIPNFETQELWLYSAPFTINNPTLCKEKILNEVQRYYLISDDIDINNAFEKIGFTFPFNYQNTTGIMWTGLKDSKPAPANYIKDLIAKWKTKNQWDAMKQMISKSSKEIGAGMSEFIQIIPKSNSGFEILENWSKAAYFQYWQSILASKIADNADGSKLVDSKEILELTIRLKKEYTDWANDWMTEKSADINAGLIYDSIINYFETP